jgi:hypothetical protein
MSTALEDGGTAVMDEGTAEAAPATTHATTHATTRAPKEKPAAAEPTFDRATLERLRVAEAAARTLEALDEGRSWTELDPAIAAHLLAHADRLRAHLSGLQDDRAVRASEPTRLMLRRLERRLEIAMEALTETAKEAASGGAALFFGDFTVPEPSDAERTDKAAKPAVAPAAPTAKQLTRTERRETSRRHGRILAYVGAGMAAVILSAVWVAVASVQEKTRPGTPPKIEFTPQAYLTDLRIFLPAVSTSLRGSDISVVVAKDWLLRPPQLRTQDAAAAHVFLMNRNVKRMLLQWEDGAIIATFEPQGSQWYEAAGSTAPGAPPAK